MKRFTKYDLGGGKEESKTDSLIAKMDTFVSENCQLYCKDPYNSALIQIFKKAEASFNYDEKTSRFSVVVVNLKYDPDEDDEEEKMIKLPLTNTMNWEAYIPAKESDKYLWGYSFDYSNKSEKGVDNRTYQLEFTRKEKKTISDLFEYIVNEILDYIDSVSTKKKKTKDIIEESSNDDVLFTSEGHLYIYNKEENWNHVIEENVTFTVRRLPEDFKYAFTVYDQSNKILINTKIRTNTQTSIQNDSGLIMWLHDTWKNKSDDLDAYLFYLLDNKGEDIVKLSKVVSKCMFEWQRQIKFEENVAEDDMEWMADTYVDGKNEESKSDYGDDADMYEGLDNDPKEYFEDCNQEFENSEMIQAHGYNRTFVSRGNGFGVYSANDDDKINYYDDFPIIKEYSEQPARNMMLYDNETTMLFLDPNSEDKIKCYDFEKCKVVEEWEAKGVKSFKSFYGDAKNSQSTIASSVIAWSDKGLYTLDPRINKADKIANSKTYSANYLFNRIAATIDGKIAVGSKNGEIRLYTKIGQNAKTMLPGLGESIIGLDLSKDGTWILATTPRYILLIPTMCKNGKNGFEHRMGKQKQIPRKLKLLNSDLVKFGLNEHSFTKATFNNGSNIPESLIVASIGSFLIVWKLRQVAKGNLGQYDIKKLTNSVVASEWRFDKDNEFIVTLPKAVTKESRKIKNVVE